MRISDCSSDVCSSDLVPFQPLETAALAQPCMGLDKVSRRMDGTVGIGNGVVKQRQGFFQASFVFLYANGLADQKSRHPPADPVFRMIMPAGVDSSVEGRVGKGWVRPCRARCRTKT